MIMLLIYIINDPAIDFFTIANIYRKLILYIISKKNSKFGSYYYMHYINRTLSIPLIFFFCF